MREKLLIIGLAIWTILVFCSMTTGFFLVVRNIDKKDIQTRDTEIYQYEEYQTTVVSLADSQVEFIFEPKNAPKFGDLAKDNSCDYAINSTFFGGSYTDAGHAGWLNIWGDKIASISDENQLSHIVSYDKSSKVLGISSKDEFYSYSNSQNLLEFQTGPIVVLDSELQQEFIDKSKNGTGEYKRTLVAFVDDKHWYLITVRGLVRLDDLGMFLMEQEIFKDKNVDIVNLDGGASVALYSKEHPEINYNNNFALPLMLCFREL